MAVKPVKFFTSAMASAPTLSGTAGNMISILDACLVDGFNTKSVTSASVTSSVLTVSATAHGFVVDQVVEISGANEATINGQWTVLTAATDSFTASATGVSNVTGTGTISVKAASAGWTKPFSGTNLAAYKAPSGNAFYLRVDDTGTTTCRVVGYETMSDINTGTEPFPTGTQVSGGAYWIKSNAASAATRTWTLVADERMFYFFPLYDTTFFIAAQCFGEFPSEKAGDVYNSILFASNAATVATTSSSWQLSSSTGSSAANLSWVARAYTGVSASAVQTSTVFSTGALSAASGSTAGITYPSPISNGLLLGTVQVKEGTALRCLKLPGIYITPQAIPLTHLNTVTGVPELSGRKLLVVKAQSTGSDGRVFFDLTGTWR